MARRLGHDAKHDFIFVVFEKDYTNSTAEKL
jgi:hypothetical protein